MTVALDRSRKSVASTVPPRKVRMWPFCWTTSRTLRSVGSATTATGAVKPDAIVRTASCAAADDAIAHTAIARPMILDLIPNEYPNAHASDGRRLGRARQPHVCVVWRFEHDDPAAADRPAGRRNDYRQRAP